MCLVSPQEILHTPITTAYRGRAAFFFGGTETVLCNILSACTLLMPLRRYKKSETSKIQAYNYFTVLAYREMAITLNRLLCSECTGGKLRCHGDSFKVLFQGSQKTREDHKLRPVSPVKPLHGSSSQSSDCL